MILADLRFAWRSLVKRPLFAAIVVLTLGLGIGANSAVFSVVNALLFSELHVRAPGELMNVYTTDSTQSGMGNTSYPDYAFIRDNAKSFSGVLGYSGLMTTITGNGQPEVLFGEMVSGNYFAVSGARLALGRGFLPSEDVTPGTHPVVVIGHRLWQRRFAGDSAIVGRTIMLNGHAFTVVGVAAPEFNGMLFRGLSADLWAPVMMIGQLRTDQLTNREERWMFVKGRLAAGATKESAVAELRVLGAQLAREFPSSNGARGLSGIPTSDVRLNPDGDVAALSGATMVMVLVGFVLLIACTNVANMMLARATMRRREIAVRLALGATRKQLVQQLTVESGLLALLGGSLGLFVAFWLARLIVAFRPPTPVPVALDVSIDLRVLAFTGLLTFVAALLFGLVPALQATRSTIGAGLSQHDPAPARRFMRLRSAFLIPQLALSLTLLIVAGLFARSVGNAGSVDAGFEIDRTAMIALNLRMDGYDEARARALYASMKQRVAALPGVQSAAVTSRIPLDLYGSQATQIVEPGVSGREESVVAMQTADVDAGYFAAMGIRMVSGRSFSESEIERQAPVAIVSEELARQFWPEGNALGQHIRFADDSSGTRAAEIVGIAANVKVQTLGERPTPFVYQPLGAGYAGLLRLVVRTTGSPALVESQLRREVAAIDPNVAVFESMTMSRHLDTMLYPFRLAAQISTLLGSFGLLLACVGLYGVVAFGVARRTREFGIRMALGARAQDVVQLVMGGSARVVAIGLGIGLLLATAVGQLISGFLFGIGGSDPLTVIAVLVTLVAVSALASYVPARRATRVNPAVALRE